MLAVGVADCDTTGEKQGDAMEEADDTPLSPSAQPTSALDPSGFTYLLTSQMIPVNTDSSIAMNRDGPFVLMPE